MTIGTYGKARSSAHVYFYQLHVNVEKHTRRAILVRGSGPAPPGGGTPALLPPHQRG
jgi:hypothetical protein